MTTGFYTDERCFWHGGGNYAFTLPVGGLVQPLAGGLPESPETKRRLLNLINATGLADHLSMRRGTPATWEEMARVHPHSYLEAFKAMSDEGGGELGMRTPFGRGGFEIAGVSAGLARSALADVLTGAAHNAYALSRPPGHHCLPDTSMGFCLLANIPIALEALRAEADSVHEEWDRSPHEPENVFRHLYEDHGRNPRDVLRPGFRSDEEMRDFHHRLHDPFHGNDEFRSGPHKGPIDPVFGSHRSFQAGVRDPNHDFSPEELSYDFVNPPRHPDSVNAQIGVPDESGHVFRTISNDEQHRREVTLRTQMARAFMPASRRHVALESGHLLWPSVGANGHGYVDIWHPDDPGDPRLHHDGDRRPTGARLDLGDREDHFPELMRQLRRPEVVRDLRDQWERARGRGKTASRSSAWDLTLRRLFGSRRPFEARSGPPRSLMRHVRVYHDADISDPYLDYSLYHDQEHAYGSGGRIPHEHAYPEGHANGSILEDWEGRGGDAAHGRPHDGPIDPVFGGKIMREAAFDPSRLEGVGPDQFRNEVNPARADTMRLYDGRYLLVDTGSGHISAHRVTPERLVAPNHPDFYTGRISSDYWDRETGQKLPAPRRVGTLSLFTGKTERAEDGTPVDQLPRSHPQHSSINGGAIWKTYVSSQHRRKGLASAMLHFARERYGEVRHSPLLSEDARAWAKEMP